MDSRTAWAGCATWLVLTSVASARQQWVHVEETKLAGSDTNANDWLGSAVAIDGDTVLVGAPHADVNERGAAYVFVRTNGAWAQQAKLVQSVVGTDLDHFGGSVALQGDTAIVGAPDWAGTNAGRVFVFQRTGTTWSVAQELPGTPGHRFGTAVAIRNDHLAVSRPFAGVFFEGAISIYTNTSGTWSLAVTFPSAYQDDDNHMGAQIALAYTGTSYVLIATTLSDAGEVFQGLGGSWSFLDVAWGGELSVEGVAASGDTVAVGSTYFNSSRGRVDVFTVSAGGLAQQATLFASDAAPGDRFGASMALDGDRLLVGAPLNGDMFGPDIGAAYVFERNGTAWSERKLLGPSDPGPSDHFGAAVAFDGATFVIGSPYDTHASGMTAGSAYVERIGFPSVSYCTAGVSTGNCVATMSSTGAPSASLATPFSIQASNVDGQRQGLIFYGTSGTYSSPWGSGSLCINQPLQRSAPQDSGGSSGACDGSLVLDWNAFVAANPGALGQPFAAGAQVWSQAWYRDPASVKTTQLSDALSFVVQP